MEPAVNSKALCEAVERSDMLDEKSPEGLKVTQITSNDNCAHSHIYMESPVFTPDSKRFVFQRILNPEEPDGRKRKYHFMLCDIEDGCSFTQITDEDGAVGPSMSPDGKYMYYFIDRTIVGGGSWAVKRLDLENFRRETMVEFDTPIKGDGSYVSRIYNLSSISSDGKRLCTAGFLGDGNVPNAPWGLVVFDIEKAEVNLILEDQTFCNMHPQYCRSKDPEASYDIMVQENHGCDIDEQGNIVKLVSGSGADIHVIRDDGSNMRSLPWGRDGVEFSQGHQCWRGEKLSIVTSLRIERTEKYPLVEGWPVSTGPGQLHSGKLIPGGRRNEISRHMKRQDSSHFSFDPGGAKMISDTFGYGGRGNRCILYIGTLDDKPDAALRTRYLLSPRTSFTNDQATHPHPFLAPDGTKAFFNSDETGVPQIWMVEGFEYPQ